MRRPRKLCQQVLSHLDKKNMEIKKGHNLYIDYKVYE